MRPTVDPTPDSASDGGRTRLVAGRGSDRRSIKLPDSVYAEIWRALEDEAERQQHEAAQ